MHDHHPLDALERNRAWHQIDALLNELINLIWHWREHDLQLELAFNRRRRSISHRQLNLPFVHHNLERPNRVQPPCPLCQARKWP